MGKGESERMRHPKIHTFLAWAGPSLFAGFVAIAGVFAALAGVYPKIQLWGERQFEHMEPVVTATWFLILVAVLIGGYIAALVYTSGEQKGDDLPLGFYDNHQSSDPVKETIEALGPNPLGKPDLMSLPSFSVSLGAMIMLPR
ncbi:MAG: hypothetical protein ACREVW_14440 [Burkholderiales bacterium]